VDILLFIHVTVWRSLGEQSSVIYPCSWVKKFGEYNGLDILLHILKSCCVGSFQGKDATLRRIQHQCVRCLRAFMNNTVSLCHALVKESMAANSSHVTYKSSKKIIIIKKNKKCSYWLCTYICLARVCGGLMSLAYLISVDEWVVPILFLL